MGRKTLILIGAITIFLLFYTQLIGAFDEKVVSPWLSKLKYDWIAWLLMVLIEIVILQFIILLRDEQKVNDFTMATSSFLLAIYIYHRCFSDRYKFYSASWAPELKYADFVLLLLMGIFILGILDRMKRKEDPIFEDDPFGVDAPISTSSKDLFGRTVFAIRMAKKIQSKLDNSYLGSLAIGITGNWGSGKTSFLNLIKSSIDERGRIIMDFNPWRSSTPAKIITDFFDQLTSELIKYDPKLSREMSAYAEKLTEIEDGWVAESVKAGADFVFGGNIDGVNYDEINNSLAGIEKQIIIFIDDLDRLENREIMEVLKVIRNTASFVNLVYVVAYDRAYVIEGLGKLNSHRCEQYLEKIFQYEFALPEVAPYVIRNTLRLMLKESFKGRGKDGFIDASVDYTNTSSVNFTDRMVTTPRAVIRLTNAIDFEIYDVIREVSFIDFYLVQLMKLAYFKVYQILAVHNDIFFVNEKGKLRLRELGETDSNFDDIGMLLFENNEKKIKDDGAGDETWFEFYLKDVLKLSKLERDLLIDLMASLLIEKDFRINSDRADYKSFLYQVNFPKYFMISSFELEISYREFEDARTGELDAYLEKVRTWVADPNKKSELERRFAAITEFDNVDEWKNHISALIEIAKADIAHKGVYAMNYKQLVETFAYPATKFKQDDFFGNEENYKKYIENFFASAESPYILEAYVLMAAIAGTSGFPMTTKEIEDQLFMYFNKYCSDNEVITQEFRSLHQAVIRKTDTIDKSYPRQERAEKLFKEYFIKNLTACDLGGFIEKYFDPNDSYYQFADEWVNNIFGSREKLIEHVKSSNKIDKESACFKEFMEFNDAVTVSKYPAIKYVLPHLKKDI